MYKSYFSTIVEAYYNDVILGGMSSVEFWRNEYNKHRKFDGIRNQVSDKVRIAKFTIECAIKSGIPLKRKDETFKHKTEIMYEYKAIK